MKKPSSQELTQWLIAWSNGDANAFDKLAAAVYDELRRIARSYMREERASHTLQTTALVNEAFMRIIDWKTVDWKNRAHFFSVAAQMMRRVLVDHARARRNLKRGGGWKQITLIESKLAQAPVSMDIVAIDQALQNLERLDVRKSKVVELRFFGGLTAEETAEVLKVSPDTVANDWRFAKSWLLRELDAGGTKNL